MGVIGLNINTITDVEYDEKIYKCTVQEITDDYIAITLPMNNGEFLIPHLNDEVLITYYDSRDVYSFYSKVTGRKRDNVPLALISIPTKVTKIQRRNFVRVDIVIQANYWILDKSANINLADGIKTKEKPIKGTILDISGGGLRIVLESKTKINDLLLVEIPMDNDNVLVAGKIVRVLKDEMGRDVIGLCFLELNESTRDKLIKFVFEVMRKQRRKV